MYYDKILTWLRICHNNFTICSMVLPLPVKRLFLIFKFYLKKYSVSFVLLCFVLVVLFWLGNANA